MDWHQRSYDEEVVSEKILYARVFIDKIQVFEMQGSSIVGQKLCTLLGIRVVLIVAYIYLISYTKFT